MIDPCAVTRARLVRLLDGDLVPAERQAAEAHLAGCPGCREALAAERRVGALLAALPEIPCPPALEQRILTAAAESRPGILLASLPVIPCPPALEESILTAAAESRPGILLASLPEIPCPPALEQRILAAVAAGELGRAELPAVSGWNQNGGIEPEPVRGFVEQAVQSRWPEALGEEPGRTFEGRADRPGETGGTRPPAEVRRIGVTQAPAPPMRAGEISGARRRAGWPAAAAVALALAAVLLVLFLPRAPVPPGSPAAYSRAEVMEARRQARAELTRAARLIRQAEEEAVRQALVVELQSRLRDCVRQKALRI